MSESKIERPEVVTEAHLEYLDELRESGVTNMLGAAPFVREAFDLSTEDSKTVHLYWMQSFGERHA